MFPHLTLGAIEDRRGDCILNKKQVLKFENMYHFGSMIGPTSGCTRDFLTTGPSLPVAVETHGKTAPISIQIHDFLSLCPPPQISTVEAMTP